MPMRDFRNKYALKDKMSPFEGNMYLLADMQHALKRTVTVLGYEKENVHLSSTICEMEKKLGTQR